jgi:hypothetical protein
MDGRRDWSSQPSTPHLFKQAAEHLLQSPRVNNLTHRHQSDREMASLAISASNQVPDYTYRPLQGSEIRLITIFPGCFHDDIVLGLSHVPLSPPRAAESPLLTLKGLRRSLPQRWNAYQIPGGRFIFRDYSFNWRSRQAVSWRHPIDEFERSRYLQPTESQHASGPAYEAVSYEWGPAQDTEVVYINGETKTKLFIRQNLASAIRYLRYIDKPRTLWADAVCINQADMDERAAQVPRMADIYRCAQLVIAWLGPPADNSGYALETLRHLGQQMITVPSGWRHYVAPDAPEPTFDAHTALPYSNSTWDALNHLLARGWFRRLWIIQEIQLAKSTIVVCGHDTTVWATFWQAAAFLEFHFRRHVVPNGPSGNAIYCALTLGLSYSTRSVSNTLARLVQGKKCTDPRDAIFGVLGLLPERFRLRIRPRYDTPVQEVYKEVMLAYIDHVERLELLAYCSLDASKSLDWPSWVPDFLNFSFRQPVFKRQFASGYSRSWTSYALHAQSGRPLLAITGVQRATITRLQAKFPAMDDISGMLATARKLQPNESAASNFYPTGETFGTVHAKTMKGNNLLERARHHTNADLEAWLPMWKTLLFPEHVDQTQAIPDGAGATKTILDLNVWDALSTLDHQVYFETDTGYVGLADGLTSQPEPGG